MKTLNLGIVAHADAGKTTLTEQILFRSGAIRAAGSVDKGTASTDTMPIERQRGISVRTACASVVWRGCRLNLIDAPGHSDFLSEVERSLAVLDAAVLVVSSVEGVQPQTRMLIQAFRRAQLPCFLFFNKLDRLGSDWQRALQSAREEFALPCLLLSAVAGEGSEAVTVTPADPSDPDWLEQAVLACGDDALLDAFLEGSLSREALCAALGRAVTAARVIPVLCGASKYGLGVPALLDALFTWLDQPAPLGGDLCARVYKVEVDETKGRAAYVRLFGGSLEPRQAVGDQKISRICRVEGRKLLDADRVAAGDIAVVYGLSQVRAGDLLGKSLPGLRDYHLTEPLLLSKVLPAAPEDLPRLTAALAVLEAEDPSLQVQWNREKQEVWVRLTGRIQIEVLQELLRERWGLAVTFGDASVIYRETPVAAGQGFEAYLAPKPCWAIVRFLIEPLPRGSGFQYECTVSPKDLPYRYQNHVQTAVPRALEQGLHGWQVTDLKVTLLEGGSHPVHTHPLDFFVATPMGIMDGLRRTGTQLLEPILQAEFTAPEEYLGRTISLVTHHRGRFDSPLLREGAFTLTAWLPAAESFDLPVEFAAATAGTGVYGSRFSHYEDCPPGLGADRERIGVNPLDRAKFILAARSALTDEN